MIRTVGSRWTGSVLVCRKCSKKAGGGFGDDGKTGLAKVLRRLPGVGKGRKAVRGVVETGCLGLCPKRAVVVVDGRQPVRWLVIPTGTPTDEIAATLGLDQPSDGV